MKTFNNNVYDPIGVYGNSEQSVSNDNNNNNDNNKLKPVYIPNPVSKTSLLATPPDNDFDCLWMPCIASKQTCVIFQNKPITKINKKTDKVHINLWGPYYPPFLSRTTYTIILLDTKTQKLWVKYLQFKDKFVNIFIT